MKGSAGLEAGVISLYCIISESDNRPVNSSSGPGAAELLQNGEKLWEAATAARPARGLSKASV